MPLRIAHRGVPSRIRENTLSSFALALDLGADGIELDVHATRDGTVVVHHDATLDDGAHIADLTLADLRSRAEQPGTGIPTLTEVCALVRDRATLYVEVKGHDIERQVLGALSGHVGEAAIHSFDHALIARLHDARCPYPLGVLFEGSIGNLEEVLDETGARDVWPHYPLVRQKLVDAVHARGCHVIPWTVNDAATARTLSAMGVDGICTDDVSLLPTEV